MSQTQQNPPFFHTINDNHVDYSEMYRTQEMKQLNKRLRKTRNILLICAFAIVGGAGVFSLMPETTFSTRDFLFYLGLAVVVLLLAVYSNRQPYISLLSALLICIGFWGLEIFFNDVNDLLIETSIQKLFIISLLVASFPSSREAELIRKELRFS